MPNTLFAVILGLLAAYAAYTAISTSEPRARTGWFITALAAGIQVFNLLTGYSTALAIATTLGIAVGFWMTRARVSRV